MKYFKKLTGTKCYLSPINIEDAEKYTEWLNDPEVARNLNALPWVLSLSREKELLDKITKEEKNRFFAIVDLKNDELLGNCGLNEVDLVNRTAELGIFIGNKKFWNRGYGQEAVCLLLDYGFNFLGLKNIMLRVFTYNKAAIRCYEKCGFRRIGIRRRAKFLAQKSYDIIYMDILAEEFQGSVLDGLSSEARPDST